jgi:hypothetical protein
MTKLTWASLAAGCVCTARGLMDRGFFEVSRPGGFAFTFENGDPDVFGYMVPVSLERPQIMLLRGEGAFPAFDASMIPSAETVYALDACDVLATGFDPFEQVLPPYRPFLLAGGVRPDRSEITPFFFAEPPCSGRRGPSREDARLLLGLLRALEVAHGRARLNLLPMGRGSGEFAVLHLSGPPEQPEVEVQTGYFGTGLDLPGAGGING